MVGNGRWAKSGCNRASSVVGQGWKSKEVTIGSKNMGVQVLTAHAFSNGKLTRLKSSSSGALAGRVL